MTTTTRAGLTVATVLADFVERETLPGTGLQADAFWEGVAEIIRDLGPRNRALLARRDDLQAQLDDYHRAHPGAPEPVAYRAFLEQIGYVQPAAAAAPITVTGVDPEIATTAGPQLVVPLSNERFALNAANARWGSLYDALYGTDAVADRGADGEDLQRGAGYNVARGAEVVARARRLLDAAAPLAGISHAAVTHYGVDGAGLLASDRDGASYRLASPAQFVGANGDLAHPSAVLLTHNGLHLEIQIDRSHPIGSADAAGVSDVLLESAITTIMDLEDSVAAVDADDKTHCYRNWLQLMQGTLTAEISKGGTTFTRRLNPDRTYLGADGETFTVPGRSVLFIRTVGHLMTTDAILTPDGAETPEGIVDTIMTGLGSLHDLRGDGGIHNSRTGSMYIVKPKMHGPEEVAFTVEVFSRVERLLGLPARTIKVGIMDEERRTTVNLAACIRAASDRIVFINTGFLDRTGDEIHTSLLAGPVVRKGQLKSQPYIVAYERANVDTGLSMGFSGRAQIGKGMWAMPDLMADMLEQKLAHVQSGATTAWVPSPTAATLHALHYHDTDARSVQQELAHRAALPLDAVLVPPLAADPTWTADEIDDEIDLNVQSILGYVVRWVDQGVGCSKVPDIHDVALMEDRATLRISSQLLANWLAHGIITEDQIDASMRRLAPVVDAQNADDAQYEPLVTTSGEGLAFRAARDLIVRGASQPNGYTEPLLHSYRRAKKAEQAR